MTNFVILSPSPSAKINNRSIVEKQKNPQTWVRKTLSKINLF